MADGFKFELVSPERLLLSERATAVIVPGTEGYFTVMANHAPLMATLKPGVVRATLASGGEKRIFVQGGFADISADGFTLLAEYATPVEEMDTQALEAEIQRAEAAAGAAAEGPARTRADQRVVDLRSARAELGA